MPVWASHRCVCPNGLIVRAWRQRCTSVWAGSARMPGHLGERPSASWPRCARGRHLQGARATTRRWPARSTVPIGVAPWLGRLAGQPGHAVVGAARGIPLRGPAWARLGCIGVRITPASVSSRVRPVHAGELLRQAPVTGPDACSSVMPPAALGRASMTPSKPEYTWRGIVHASWCAAASQQRPAHRARCGSRGVFSSSCRALLRQRLRPLRAPAHSCPARADVMGFAARAMAASVTRPWASSTRMALALQGLHSGAGTVARARAKRASRTVKYWAPWSKRAKGRTARGHAPAGRYGSSRTR
jgi:hypothetical protein